MNEQTITQQLPISTSVIVTKKNGQPALELRKVTTNQETIKHIISSTFHQTPIIIQPIFTNKLESLNSLMDKGIIYKGEDGQFYYTF